MDNTWFDRNERFFGPEGQENLRAARVAVVGVGGLGSHVVQQLALLGVGSLALIDSEELEDSNRNRYVGVRHDDPVPGTPKVTIGERLTREINPEIVVTAIGSELTARAAFDSISRSHYVFGCLDNDGGRLILTELCAAYAKPYFDVATDILVEDSRYGGRVVVAWGGQGCAVCLGELDIAEAQLDLMTPGQRRDRASIYGIPREDGPGPSVVSINGVVASLAVTEFMLAVTGIRPKPRRLLRYHADSGGVRVDTSEPAPDCYYCRGIRGQGDSAGVERYLC